MGKLRLLELNSLLKARELMAELRLHPTIPSCAAHRCTEREDHVKMCREDLGGVKEQAST